jgi:hypothetical protein
MIRIAIAAEAFAAVAAVLPSVNVHASRRTKPFSSMSAKIVAETMPQS